MIESLEARLDKVRRKQNPILPSVSMGYSVYQPGMDKEAVVEQADKQMYIHKNGSSRF